MRTLLSLSFLTSSLFATAQTWNVATTFGSGGNLSGVSAITPEGVSCHVLRPDGKLLLGGTSGDGGINYNTGFFVIDTACGIIDPTFGTGGYAEHIFEFRTVCSDVELQPDGKILACGQIAPSNNSGEQYPGVYRMHPDGSLDTTFNHTGYVRPTFNGGAGHFYKVYATDTTITCVGANGDGWLGVQRYLYDGSPDTSFGTNGASYLNIGNWGYVGEGTALMLPDGAYISCMVWNNAPLMALGLAKFLNDGSPDTTFGNNGIVQTTIESRGAMGLAVQADGKILVSSKTAPQAGFVMSRYLPDGTLDTSFGAGGVSFGTGGGGEGTSLAVLADGTTIQFGKAGPLGSAGPGGILPRDANGTIDLGTGAEGFLQWGVGWYFNGGCLLPSGRVIMYGSTFGPDCSVQKITPLSNDGLPVISQVGTDLFTTGIGSYQWFFNGAPISGATSNTYTPTENGDYTVELTVTDDCSFLSSVYTMLNVGVEEVDTSGLYLISNPVTDVLRLVNDRSIMPCTIVDARGSVVMNEQMSPGMNSIVVSHLLPGMYLLRTASGTVRFVKE